ncbi:unnamed protein product (macronuclear) [Paramecium tetraurelia]|uniref:RING-type domain-containing protein n=1 Tax=Paramecium tetraurelia TaxID=5888 RepID=A0BHQ2_PARTE|nr:uncharacterized protein GSPATT00029105001 [Paramecium tetraurelia]CAK58069.1 unnamed protein product [Paramecium tetraurelia]|eukprot:XP_001425467.1 hypothetical protein (macronuclear) [Paramecium tetraurelia strain d4-2]
MNSEQECSYEEQRMLSQYQQHVNTNRHGSIEDLKEHYVKLIKASQLKIKYLLIASSILLLLTTITSLSCLIDPKMVGIELCKWFSHLLTLILYLAIYLDLKNANIEILNVPKENLKLLCLTYEKNVYEFLEEFKFQEKFDLINVLMYSSFIWSFWFSQFLFILHTNSKIYPLLIISYILHMVLYLIACIHSCFRQSPGNCECSILKTKAGYQYINLPRFIETKKNTLKMTIILLMYYKIKLAVIASFIDQSESETVLVIYLYIIYCGTMILKQLYHLILLKMIKKVNQRHLSCYQNAYMLYYKLFFYESCLNKTLKAIIYLSSFACVIVCLMFNLKNYFKYIQESIYKIEVYLVNDTICFVISLLIYIYYAVKKYSNRVSLDHLESYESRFDMRFYDLNDVVPNPYYNALSRYLQMEQQQLEERNHRELIRKLQLSPERSINLEENVDCIICREKLLQDQLLVGLQCHPSHIFHKECLIKWVLLHTTCPTCRSSIQ